MAYSQEIQDLVPEEWRSEFKEFTIVEGHGLCALKPLMYTVGLFTHLKFDNGLNHEFEGRYCYPHAYVVDALIALKHPWKVGTDPYGNWIKYKGKGPERTNPNYHEKKDNQTTKETK